MSNTNIKKVRTSDLELKDRLVSIQRVTKVTKGGRTFSFSAIVVVGNEDGVVGYGLGKASEVQSAIAKGVEDAKKNLVKIPVINGTIPHKQESRYSGSLVMIRPAAPVRVSSPAVPCVPFWSRWASRTCLPKARALRIPTTW